MEGILKFELPREEVEFKQAVNAGNAYAALWEFYQYLRKKIKYEDLPEHELAIYERIREEFLGTLDGYNVHLE
mgnify:CR=1 FL=1|jgi:hypothetical protein|tara:strand:- start:2114 stop:2332 length:219 start_codon:yes stop_codon:yes gene_type:complete